MRTRTLSREAALQYLYEVDILGRGEAEPLEEFLERQVGRASAREYAGELVKGVLTHKEELDRIISEVSENWTLERMAIVDRNILRLGVYELRFVEDVPPKVAIDEAIELARRFSTEDACAFVNGILDKVLEKYPRAVETEGAGAVERP